MLGGGGHNKKGTRNDDFVACSKCGHRLTRKLVAEHYEIHKNGGKGYPKHPRNAYTKLYDELEDPKNKQSKLLKVQSVLSMFGVSVPNDACEHEEKLVEDTEYKHKKRNHKPPLRDPSVSLSIQQLFERINENILEEDKLNSDQKYFNKKMKCVMANIDQKRIELSDLIEDESCDFQSTFELLQTINETLLQSKHFINNISNIFSKHLLDVHTLCDLILKYYYNGSRVTVTARCENGEAIKYCAVCCDDPQYPTTHPGDIVHGRVVALDVAISDPVLFDSLKKADRQHFIHNERHWANLLNDGKNRHKGKVFEAQSNQFKLILRMILSNVSMAQWPNWLYRDHLLGINVGNIGQSNMHCKKLIKFAGDKIIRDIGNDIKEPRPSTHQGKCFSGSWDKVSMFKKKLEPGLMKMLKNGYFQMRAFDVSELDYKSELKKGNGRSLAMNKCDVLRHDLQLKRGNDGIVWVKRTFTGAAYDRQYFKDHVPEIMEEELALPETHQAVNDPCHQWELAQDVKKKNQIVEESQLYLNREVLNPLAHGSNAYVKVKNKMDKAWKGISPFVDVKYHAHKSKSTTSLDNASIALNDIYTDNMQKHPPRDPNKPSKDYKKWKKQSTILKSLQWNVLNKFDPDLSALIDAHSTNYQSPNQPWHAFKSDTESMIDVYTYYLSHLLNYQDDLETMTVDEFTQKKHLFSPQILGLFPSLMAFTQKDGKVYKRGNLKRIETKYSCKKYVNDEAIQNTKQELLDLHHEFELELTLLKKKSKEHCYHCGEQNWNLPMIECADCKGLVHIECDDIDDIERGRDAEWYKDQNTEYVCSRCAGSDDEDEGWDELIGNKNVNLFYCENVLVAMREILSIMVKYVQLLISGLHYKMMYPSLIDEIHTFLNYDDWFDLIINIRDKITDLKHCECLESCVVLDDNDDVIWNEVKLWKICDIDLENEVGFVDEFGDVCMDVYEIAKLQSLILKYQLHGHSEIAEFIEIFNDDDELKKLEFTTEQIIEQQSLAKSRLFIMYCNGSFDTTHRILQKHFNKLFKYKWQEYNTLVWIMFEREIFYDGIHDYLYLAEYFLSQGCPESMVESACSILSIILLFCAGLKIDMINAIFIIRYYLGGDEFGFGYQFVDEVTKEYLSCNRGPITSSRSKYPIGKVFERIQKGTGIETSLVSGIETALAAMNCERRAFSDHESDHESDDDVIMNTRFMDANDVTLGFD
eukprot:148704_1